MLSDSIDLGDDRIDHWVGTVHHGTGESADAGEVDWPVDQRGLRVAAKGSDDALYPVCWVLAVSVGAYDDVAACLLKGVLACTRNSLCRLVDELKVQSFFFSHLDGDMGRVIGACIQADDRLNLGRCSLPSDGAQAISDAILFVIGRDGYGNQYFVASV